MALKYPLTFFTGSVSHQRSPRGNWEPCLPVLVQRDHSDKRDVPVRRATLTLSELATTSVHSGLRSGFVRATWLHAGNNHQTRHPSAHDPAPHTLEECRATNHIPAHTENNVFAQGSDVGHHSAGIHEFSSNVATSSHKHISYSYRHLHTAPALRHHFCRFT